MFCVMCGAEAPDAARYCPACGQAMHRARAEEAPPSEVWTLGPGQTGPASPPLWLPQPELEPWQTPPPPAAPPTARPGPGDLYELARAHWWFVTSAWVTGLSLLGLLGVGLHEPAAAQAAGPTEALAVLAFLTFCVAGPTALAWAWRLGRRLGWGRWGTFWYCLFMCHPMLSPLLGLSLGYASERRLREAGVPLGFPGLRRATVRQLRRLRDGALPPP